MGHVGGILLTLIKWLFKERGAGARQEVPDISGPSPEKALRKFNTRISGLSEAHVKGRRNSLQRNRLLSHS